MSESRFGFRDHPGHHDPVSARLSHWRCAATLDKYGIDRRPL